MAGYNKVANKSNNALYAEEDFILMRKEAVLFLIENFSTTKKEAEFILDWSDNSEWHHVGSRFRKVKYYDLSWAERHPSYINDMREEAWTEYRRERETAEFLHIDSSAKISQSEFVDMYLAGVLKARRDPRQRFSTTIFLDALEN